jgi:hypothetical protein
MAAATGRVETVGCEVSRGKLRIQRPTPVRSGVRHLLRKVAIARETAERRPGLRHLLHRHVM